MAVRTDTVDRLLEALSPTLAAELERVVNETKEVLEAEFEKRLGSAVREAELVAQRAADAQTERTVADTRERVRKSVTEELERQFRSTLDEAAMRASRELEERNEQLRRSFEEATSRTKAEWNLEKGRLQEQLDQWRAFAEAQRQLGEASSQAEILMRFLRIAAPFAAGVAVYVAKADGLALWKSRGQAVFPQVISEETTDPDFFFRGIVVRGRAVAAVYAAMPYNTDVLSFLVATMERAIEFFGLRLRMPSAKASGMTETTVAASPQAGQAYAAAAALPGEDQKPMHAQARKAARSLISEIKNYHERELREGREHFDIYRRLQKEIDHGRELYKRQVSGAVLSSHDYFHEELVRILTENDPSRLGENYPGPLNS